YGYVRFQREDQARKALIVCNEICLDGYKMHVEYAQNNILINPLWSSTSQSVKEATYALPQMYNTTGTVPKRFEFGLSIVNIHTNVKTFDLLSYCNYYGLVKYCRITDKRVGFVSFNDDQSTDAFLRNNPHLLNGHQMSATFRRKKFPSKYIVPQRLFISRLDPLRVTKKDLREYFEQFGGQIITIDIITQTGHAFLTFEYDRYVRKIVDMPNRHCVNGTFLSVNRFVLSKYRMVQKMWTTSSGNKIDYNALLEKYEALREMEDKCDVSCQTDAVVEKETVNMYQIERFNYTRMDTTSEELTEMVSKMKDDNAELKCIIKNMDAESKILVKKLYKTQTEIDRLKLIIKELFDE
ncbi:unnamed protein product, partial [Didymodactylos carnosus]